MNRMNSAHNEQIIIQAVEWSDELPRFRGVGCRIGAFHTLDPGEGGVRGCRSTRCLLATHPPTKLLSWRLRGGSAGQVLLTLTGGLTSTQPSVSWKSDKLLWRLHWNCELVECPQLFHAFSSFFLSTALTLTFYL